MNKVLFVDIDGVLLPGRMYALPANRNGKPRTYDPAAVAMFNTLMKLGPCQFVISSTWGLAALPHLSTNGFDVTCIHPDSITPRNHIGLTMDQINARREQEVKEWVARHPEVTHWCAIDDLPINHPNAIQVSFNNGILVDDYNKAFEILEIPLP